MQREELSLQRKELEETRKVFEKQSKIMDQQQSDAQFFNLLQNHRQMVQSLDKQVKKYQPTGRATFGSVYTKELESGYQFLTGVAEAWRGYLSTYSDMSFQRVLYSLEILQFDPIDVVRSNELIRSFVNETEHLASFLDVKFGGTDQFDFYRETLVRSLLESEKFIVSAWYDVLLNKKVSSPFGLDMYQKHKFVDFQENRLPNLSVSITERKRNGVNRFEFIFQGEVRRYFSVMDRRSWQRSQFELPEIISKEVVVQESGKLNISILDYLEGTSQELKVNSIPENEVFEISKGKHFIVLEIEHSDRTYFVPVEFMIESREDWDRKGESKDEKFYQVYLTRRNREEISRERALEIVELVKTSFAYTNQ